MSALNCYLIAGLLLHKLVWEVLKRAHRPAPTRSGNSVPIRLKLIKALKVAILSGIAVQTAISPVLPISNSPPLLTWVGVLIYTAGLGLALAARFELGKNWSDIEVGTVRADHRIVETGVYRHIRHPIYVGDLALLVGLELALNSWLVIGAILLIPLVLRKAIAEERSLRRTLPGYEEYCGRTKRFIGLRRPKSARPGTGAYKRHVA